MKRWINIPLLIQNSEILQQKLDELFHGESLNLGIEVLPEDIQKDIINDPATAEKKYKTRVHLLLNRPELFVTKVSEQTLVNISQVLRISQFFNQQKELWDTSTRYNEHVSRILHFSVVRESLWYIEDEAWRLYWEHWKELLWWFSAQQKKETIHFLRPFRLSHGEWFFTDKKNHTEWYHPYLVLVLKDYLKDKNRVRRMPSGWISGKDILEKFNISKKQLESLRKKTDVFNPDWIEQFSKYPGQFFLWYAPEFVQKLREYIFPPKDWEKLEDIGKKYSRTHVTLLRYCKKYGNLEKHLQKYFIDGSHQTYISSECARSLHERFGRVRKRKTKSSLPHEIPDNWVSWKELVTKFSLTPRQFLLLRQKTKVFKSEWIKKIVDPRGRAILIFSPEFANALSKIKFPPKWWIPVYSAVIKYKKSWAILVRLCKNFDFPNIHFWSYYDEWGERLYLSPEFTAWLEKKIEMEREIRATHKTKTDLFLKLSPLFWKKIIQSGITYLAEKLKDEYVSSPNSKGNECIYYTARFEEKLIEHLTIRKEPNFIAHAW